MVCEMEPGFFRECDSMTRNWQGRLEILSVLVHVDGDSHVNDYEDEIAPSSFEGQSADSASELNGVVQRQLTISTESANSGEQVKHKCSTCNALVGDAKQYRDHFKSDWHKHNLKRKTRQLPPLTLEECMTDMELEDSKNDLKEYSF